MSNEPSPMTEREHVSGLEDTMAARSEKVSGLEDTMAVEDSEPGTQATLTDMSGSKAPAARDDVASELAVVDRTYYRVDHELARGGMGRILRARDQRHGRVVALKESLRREPTLIARFTREAMITARLQHPAIVPVYEAGRWASGDPFYAMKLVEGTSLAREIEKRKSLGRRMELLPNLLAVADALAYAHTHGIIHRDLKPSNVLIGSFGETVVIDWGLAKMVDGDEDPACEPDAGPHAASRTAPDAAPDLTALGHVLGTPAYMAPEQASGESVDQRADVYSLGAIAYHLLCGDAPYEGNSSADVLERVLQGPPRAVRERECHVPADLAAIVEKAMAREPSRRYPSAKELASELRRFHTGQLVSTHEYSAFDLARRFLARHRASVTVAAVMLMAMIGLGGYAFSRIVSERNNARAERERAEKSRLVAMQQRQRAENLSVAILAMLDERRETTGEELVREDVAQQLLTYYDSAERVDFHDLAAIEPAARGLHFLAKKAHLEGQVEQALSHYRRSQALAEKMAQAGQPSRELRRLMAENRGRMASLLAARGEHAEARDEYRRAIDLFQSMAGPDGPDIELHARLGQLYSQLGLLLFMAEDTAGSLAAYEQSRAHARALARATAAGAADRASAPRLDAAGMNTKATRLRLVSSRIESTASTPDDIAPLVQVVRGDPDKLVKLSDAPASMGLMLSLENLDQQLHALGHEEESIEVHSKLAKVLEKHDGTFERASSALARAELYMNLARKLAPLDRQQAANYAGQCVNMLEKEPVQGEHAAELQSKLAQARATLDQLRIRHQEPGQSE